jgi:hypothetical protein
MSALPFDLAAAHRYFAAYCFNEAWKWMDITDRSADDTEAMIQCCLASLWHWRQRSDATSRNLSIGYWQASRVYALAGQAANAWRYGELCLKASEGEEPFYLGYAYEALARAARMAGDEPLSRQYLQQAQQFAAQVPEGEERSMLLQDLASLSPS